MGGGVSEAGPPSPWAGGPVYKYPAEEPGKGMFKWQWLPVSHHCTENLAARRTLWSVSVTGRSFTKGHLGRAAWGSSSFLLWLPGHENSWEGEEGKETSQRTSAPCSLPFLSASMLFTFIFSGHVHNEFLSPSVHSPNTNTFFCMHSAALARHP